jgi:hypothetical protein
MWTFKMLLWIILLVTIVTAIPRLSYSAAELHRLRLRSAASSCLLSQRDILRRPKYIHRGSRRNFSYNISNSISSFWSTGHRKPHSTERKVDHSVLASLLADPAVSFKGLKCSLFNVRSLSNKGLLIADIIVDSKLDFLCLTETWQQPEDYFHLNHALPPEFVYTSKPRLSGRGGGLALIYREKRLASHCY